MSAEDKPGVTHCGVACHNTMSDDLYQKFCGIFVIVFD